MNLKPWEDDGGQVLTDALVSAGCAVLAVEWKAGEPLLTSAVQLAGLVIGGTDVVEG